MPILSNALGNAGSASYNTLSALDLRPPCGKPVSGRPDASAECSTPVPHVYNCAKCPGYCCSYPVIALSKRDVERLARHLGLSVDDCERRHTRAAWGHKRIMRRKPDPHFRGICRFFDTEARRCTVYAARPAVCRRFPGEGRCGYYDFLSFERRAQGDPDFVAVTNHEG